MNFSELKQVASADNETQVIAFRLPADDKQALIELCERENLGFSQTMRFIVKSFLTEVAANADTKRQ